MFLSLLAFYNIISHFAKEAVGTLTSIREPVVLTLSIAQAKDVSDILNRSRAFAVFAARFLMLQKCAVRDYGGRILDLYIDVPENSIFWG